jgi:hypothetical protein
VGDVVIEICDIRTVRAAGRKGGGPRCNCGYALSVVALFIEPLCGSLGNVFASTWSANHRGSATQEVQTHGHRLK